MIGTRTVYSLQFLSTANTWVSHLQCDTEKDAWAHLDRLERAYSNKRWRWVLATEDSRLHFLSTAAVANLTKTSHVA
jgi:hypothetical protein